MLPIEPVEAAMHIVTLSRQFSHVIITQDSHRSFYGILQHGRDCAALGSRL